MKLFLVFMTIFSTNIYPTDLLLESCNKRNGSVVRGHLCPKSKIPIPARACFYNSSHNETQFYNGCSGPTGVYKETFYSSCIQHDLCYHNEPASNGLSQKTCDLMDCLMYEVPSELYHTKRRYSMARIQEVVELRGRITARKMTSRPAKRFH